MVVYTGVRRRTGHYGANLALDKVVSKPKQTNIKRMSSYASTITRDQQQQFQAEGLRSFTDNANRHFVSDATLVRPYGNLAQVGAAMRGNKGTPNNNVMIRKNNYEELPEWMGRIQTLHSTPMARQRMAELQHHDEERRLRAESHPGRKRKIASSRLQKPANREEEPYMSQHPYVRTMIPDRSAMRDEPTVPHTSFQTVIGQVPWNTNSMRNDSNANTIPDISGVSLQTTQCHSHSYGDDRPPFSNRPTAVTER